MFKPWSMSSENQFTIPPTATGPQTVLVTGATGKVGRHLTRYLLAAGHRVRALTRNPVIAGLPEGVELRTGDPTRADTVAAAADGADAAFLVWMGFDATGVAETAAALARNVGHIVYLSAAELQDGRRGAKPGVWADVEAAVRDTGATWTFLRAGGFAANTLGWARVIRAGEPVGMPYPEAVRSSVHEADIAEAAWRCVLDPEHQGRAYDITGPQQLTQRREAELIHEVVGRPVRVHHQSPDEARREMSAVMGPDYADAALRYWATLESSPERVSDGVAQITGHPARTFAEWAADHVADFRLEHPRRTRAPSN
jgi:uncharacterized protein YbjT (DUF2867 family)